VEDTNVPDGNVLADEVEINLNMLGALVLDGVGGEVDGVDVVAVDQSGPRQGVVQLHEQLTKPAHLRHVVGHGAVLCLSAQTGDDVMALRGPGDKVVTQEHRVVRNGPASVGTTGPVSVSVDDEVRRQGAAKKQPVVEGALEVTEDALHGHEMGLTGIMHVEAHLLDRVGDVKPGESEVLESPGQAAVGSRVADRGPHVGRDLGRHHPLLPTEIWSPPSVCSSPAGLRVAAGRSELAALCARRLPDRGSPITFARRWLSPPDRARPSLDPPLPPPDRDPSAPPTSLLRRAVGSSPPRPPPAGVVPPDPKPARRPDRDRIRSRSRVPLFCDFFCTRPTVSRPPGRGLLPAHQAVSSAPGPICDPSRPSFKIRPRFGG
jgi:hypothetical protein